MRAAVKCRWKQVTDAGLSSARATHTMDEASCSSRHSKKHKKKEKKRHSKSKKHNKKRRRRSSSRESSSSDQPFKKVIAVEKSVTSHHSEINVDRDYSHQETLQLVQTSLNTLLASDPLLSDLPPCVTLDEVRSLIALEHGQAIRVVLEREDRTSLSVIVKRGATVRELKRAVEKATELKLNRDYAEKSDRPSKISWKYIWKSYWLMAHNRKLKEEDATLKDCSIANNDRLSFVKRLREK